MHQKPGEIPKGSGEYEERGPRGGKIPNARRVTIEVGNHKLPPTRRPNRYWVKLNK